MSMCKFLDDKIITTQDGGIQKISDLLDKKSINWWYMARPKWTAKNWSWNFETVWKHFHF